MREMGVPPWMIRRDSRRTGRVGEAGGWGRERSGVVGAGGRLKKARAGRTKAVDRPGNPRRYHGAWQMVAAVTES